MNEDNIIQSVIYSLNTLKNEYEKVLDSIVQSSEVLSLNKIEEKINLGIDEGQMMIQLDYCLQNLEAEKYKLYSQIKCLRQENFWLREELGLIQRKFHDSQQINTSYLNEIEQLKEMNIIDELDIDFTDQDDIFNENDEDEIPTRSKTLHDLVIQYVSQGQYEIAVPLCRQALEDLETTVGHQHPDVASMLNILALIYRDQLKFKEASVLLHEVLSIREKTLGLDHPIVAATLNNLAVLYGKCNQFKEAESFCRRALEIREKCFGFSHPDVAKQLNNLALILQNQGNYDEVESYYQRSIEIYTENFGLKDINVIKTKINLASVYLKQQNYQKAEDLYKDILIHASQLMIKNPLIIVVLKNLSVLYRRQGRYDLADALEKYILHAPDDSHTVLEVLNNL